MLIKFNSSSGNRKFCEFQVEAGSILDKHNILVGKHESDLAEGYRKRIQSKGQCHAKRQSH